MKHPWAVPLVGWVVGGALSQEQYFARLLVDSGWPLELAFGGVAAVLLALGLAGNRWCAWGSYFILFGFLGWQRTREAWPPEPEGPSRYVVAGVLWDKNTLEDDEGLWWRVVWRDTLHRPTDFPSRWAVEGRVEPLLDPRVPGGFSARAVYGPQGFSGRYWVEQGQLVARNQEGFALRGWLVGLQSYASAWIDRWAYSGETRGLIRALLVGDRSGITPELREGFARLGLAHIVSISGFHMSLIFSFFAALAARSGRRSGRRWEVLGLVVVVLFTAVSGAAPSAVRSAAMTSFAVVGRWLHRPQAGLHQLTLVALALLVLFPLWFFDLGFQLSVVSLAGIMLWTPKDVGPRAAAWWTSWAAQMATIPLTVVVFHQFSWVFLASNAVAGPLFEILLGVWIVQGMVEWLVFSVAPLGALEGVWRGWELHWAHWVDEGVALLVHWGLHPKSASEGLFPSEVQQFIALGLALGAAWTVWRVSGVGRWVLAAAWVPVWFFWTLSLHELPAAHAVVYRTTYSWVLEVCTPDTAWSYATANQYQNDFFWSVETAPVRQRLRGSAEPGGQVPVWNESLERCIRNLPDWDSTHCYQQWTWKNGEWKKVEFLSDA